MLLLLDFCFLSSIEIRSLFLNTGSEPYLESQDQTTVNVMAEFTAELIGLSLPPCLKAVKLGGRKGRKGIQAR